MAQRRHHYERAFEAFLRRRRIPYVSVDEARKALLPEAEGTVFQASGPEAGALAALKSFDFVVYGRRRNLLLEVKGRKASAKAATRSALQSWVTEEDLESLEVWGRLFGPDFAPAFVFVYWCEQPPPDSLFQEIYEHAGRWYALRAVRLDRYRRHMRPRSARWRTVHVPAAAFESISHPFVSTEPLEEASPSDPRVVSREQASV